MSFMRALLRSIQVRGVPLLAVAYCHLEQFVEPPAQSLNRDVVPVQLTPADCIRQACLLSVNSSITLLTTTVHSIVDTAERYKIVLSRLITLLEEYAVINESNSEIWDEVIELRLEATCYQEEFKKLLLFMNNVEKVIEATAEASFNADAEYVCKTLCERSHAATVEVNKCKKEVEDLEHFYLKAQVYAAKYDSKTENLQNEGSVA